MSDIKNQIDLLTFIKGLESGGGGDSPTFNFVAGPGISVDIEGDTITISGTYTYTIPQATSTGLGGIKASSRTPEYTNEVKIDNSTGKLYTIPNENSVTIRRF